MTAQTAAAVTTALATFIGTSNNPNPVNQTGITSIASTSLQAVGATTKTVIVTMYGDSAYVAKGIEAVITLPQGVTLRSDAGGTLYSGIMATTGSASNSLLAGKYTPPTTTAPATLKIGLVDSGTLSAGDIITINADVAAGVTPPASNAFTVTESNFVDTNGKSLSGVSLVMR